MCSANPAYPILLLCGILLSAVLYLLSSRRGGLSLPRAAAGFLSGLLLAFLFAKALYVLLNGVSLSDRGPEKWFRLVPEEFSFVAGAVGFCLGALAVHAGNPENLSKAADRLVFPGCLLAACLRFGEIYLGQLGLTEPWSLGLPDLESGSLFARFPFAVPDAWGSWYPAVSTLSALLILLTGLWGLYLLKKQNHASGDPAGMVFETCAFLLCCFRFFLELTRMKSLIFYFVHADQVLCAVVMTVLMIRAGLRLRKSSGRFPFAFPILLSACFALNGAVQYLMDKPWQFEPVLPEGVFTWISENLAPFGSSLLLLTSLLPAVLFLLLRRKIRQAGAGKS